MSTFGPVVTGEDVIAAVEATVRLWQYDYLGELAVRDERDRGALPRIRDFIPSGDLDKFPEDRLPACVIVMPGTAQEPTRHQGGLYVARWAFGLAPIVSAKDRTATRRLCGLYTAALRTLVVQRGDLGGFARATTWLGETYHELDSDRHRTIQAGIVRFVTEVDDVVDARQGPMAPTEDPDAPGGPQEPGQWPIVQTTHVTVEAKE